MKYDKQVINECQLKTHRVVLAVKSLYSVVYGWSSEMQAQTPVLLTHQECFSPGTSLVVQWLRICLPKQGDMGSIPGRRTEVTYAAGQLSLHTTATEALTF